MSTISVRRERKSAEIKQERHSRRKDRIKKTNQRVSISNNLEPEVWPVTPHREIPNLPQPIQTRGLERWLGERLAQEQCVKANKVRPTDTYLPNAVPGPTVTQVPKIHSTSS